MSIFYTKPMDVLTPDQLEELLTDLVQLREELQRQLEASREGAKPVDLNEPIGRLTRMDAIQQQKMTEATRRETKLRLMQTEAALLRHESGDYGFCIACEEPVRLARLKVRPETTSCVDCQSRRER